MAKRTRENPRPLRVAYDIARMTAGGANGGIKTHHYEFLRVFAETHGHELSLCVFCQEEIVPELSFLSAGPYNQIHILGPRGARDFRDSDGSLPPLRYWPERPKDLLPRLGIDVLYCGFGFSELYLPEVPQASLIVDVLHRAYPESLPPAEVAFRDRWHAEAIERSALVQTNSHYCKQQLVGEFGAAPERVFTISLPLHGRFNRVEMGELPTQLQPHAHRYFLYPANYWPHKNHRRLLEAYALYAKEAGHRALSLVLTGALNENAEAIRQLADELGIGEAIYQLGHLDLPSYKAVWEMAHSLVFPTLYEGFGLPLLEAMYFQKPVACSDHPSLDAARPAQALRFPPERPKAIAAALTSLQQDPTPYKTPPEDLDSFNLNTESTTLYQNLLQAAKSPSPSRTSAATSA